MANIIKCKNCGQEIEVSQALTHQIEEQVMVTLKEQVRIEVDEEKLRNKKLASQIDDLLTEIRKLRRKDEEREMEMKKKIVEEEERIRSEAKQKADQEHQLKDMEKDKKLNDALKQVDELKIRMQQGSQQTQGESLELELETKLKLEFPLDTISEVKKGQRGADIFEEVVDKLGRKCGTILWESKNAKWSEEWAGKLKEDQRQAKADLAVLVSVNLPQGIETFAYRNGIWVCGWKHFIALAWALRFNLISLHHERQSQDGKEEKMKVLYDYLTGNEFKHRVEGIVEAFNNLQEEIEREKRWFSTKWARQEKEIRKVMDHTHGMYGDFQGVIGKALPEITTLELTEETTS